MAIFTVGPNSTYPSIAAAMAAAGPGDTIQLEPGYSDETATVTHSGMTITGEASSTGIVLRLATGIATVTLAGAAPIDLADAADGNGIAGNDGANLITVTGGMDSVTGGLGVDRLFVDYRLATGAITGDSTSNVAEAGGGRTVTIGSGFEHFTIWTGGGADTITTGAGDDDIRTGEGAGTVTAGEGANYIVGGGGADTITAGDGGNFVDAGDGANTVTTGNGSDTILGGIGADTVVAGGGDDTVTVRGGADNVNAGVGSDLLIVDYSAATTNVTGGVVSGNLATGYSGHLADVAAATLDFSGVEALWITTGRGHDRLVTGAGDDVAATGAGNDFVDFSQGGNDRGDGGSGDDVFILGATLNADDSIDGGLGDKDQLGIQGDYGSFGLGAAPHLLSSSNLIGIETLALLSGTDARFGDSGANSYSYNLRTADTNVAAGRTLVVNFNDLRAGEDVVFDGSAETDGAFFFYAGQGTDLLTGGAGNDGFYFGGGAFGPSDQVHGGGGNVDQLALRGDYDLDFTANSMSGIETIAFLSGGAGGSAAGGPGFDYAISLDDANVAAGRQLSVSANELTASESLDFDGSSETDGTFFIKSGRGDDSLTGGAGADIIYGNHGQDVLTGGGGADRFVYRAAAESSSTGYDTIADFDYGADKLDLPGDGSGHNYSGATGGALSTATFDQDLADGLAGYLLNAKEFAFFTADSGDLAGRTFLVVDANGIDGYQAGQDYVIDIAPPPVPVTGDFFG